MNKTLPGRSLSPVLYSAAAVLFLLLVALFLYDRFAPGRPGANQGAMLASEREKITAGITAAFRDFHDGIENTTRAAAGGLAARGLAGNGADALHGIFGHLEAVRPPDITLELYDSAGSLTAWRGTGGPEVDRRYFTGETVSFISDGPIYSYLAVIVPVLAGGRPAGYLVGKRPFNVNHPINNRFVSNRALAVSFASMIDPDGRLGVRYHVKKSATARIPAPPGLAQDTAGADEGNAGPGQTAVISLKSRSGVELAYAVIPLPDPEFLRQEGGRTTAGWMAAVSVLLVAVLLWMAVRFLRRAGLDGTAFFFALLGLWFVRYILVWLDVPAVMAESDLFTPVLFASAFGSGLAGSLGDMFLSAVAISVTMVMIWRRLLRGLAHSDAGPLEYAVSGAVSAGRRTLLAAVLLVLVGMLGPLTRGVYAIVRSAVFDSRIDLNDPTVVYPGPEMGMLLLGVFLLVFAAVVGGLIIIFASRYVLRKILTRRPETVVRVVLTLLVLGSSLAFDLLHINPLGSPPERVLMLGGLLALAYLIDRRRGVTAEATMRNGLLAAAVAAVITVIPMLDAQVHEHEKSMVETVARNLARPEDSWMTFLMNEALDEMSAPGVAGILGGGDYGETEKLAFSGWAGSVLGREGNNCSVTYIDVEGSVVSYFHVGVAPHWSREYHMDEMPRSTRMISREMRTLRGKLTTWYRGYAPVFTADSQFVGGVWVGISPLGPEKVLRQEYDLLTTSRKYEHRTRSRDVMLTEFVDGKLSYSSNEDVPFGSDLRTVLGDGRVPAEGTWKPGNIGGTPYEVFYLPRTDRTVLGIGLQSLDTAWHFYSYSRYVLFFLSVLAAGALLYAVRRFARAAGRTVSFRAKLVTGFSVVAVIPVVLLAYYNRTSLLREADESTQSFLRSETEVVLNEVEGRMGTTVPYELSLMDDESLEEIAARIKTEFYMFRGDLLQGSSRPELFAAELIDRRISADAYQNLYLLGKNFFAEPQTIGTIAYVVGYRPLRAPSGEVIGAVAVPTLFRQGEVEENIAREDVVLSGIYLLVLAVSLLIGTLLADQISRPMRRLIAAARRVATGDLDVRIGGRRTDEIGELESAFDGMTADLRGVQEKMKKVERELAWKEMAKQVAHEIKNPLTPMRLSIQHLASAYRDRATEFGDLLKKVSSTVLEQIDALSRIASEFSSFARFPERKIETVDLSAVLTEAAALHGQDRVEFRLAFAPEPIAVRADREELRRAFINIFRNSIQAAPSGVVIEVATAAVPPVAEVTITDNGPGVDDEVRERLFEPNFSTKTGGMGIGLTIVRKTVEDIGGSISIWSASGAGTTVRITLPMTSGDDTRSSPPSAGPDRKGPGHDGPR